MPNALVRKLTGYAPLDGAEIGLLATASAAPREVAAHRDLIREGEEPGPVFVVLDGWACRYKVLPDGSRQIVAFMMPGDFCDMHIGSLEEMDHSVGTLTPCRIATISRDAMERLIVGTPRLTHAFWRAQLVDSGVLRAWIVSMGRRDAIERVAHLMLELYVRMRAVGLARDETCQMPLTQTVLADALGMTRGARQHRDRQPCRSTRSICAGATASSPTTRERRSATCTTPISRRAGRYRTWRGRC